MLSNLRIRLWAQIKSVFDNAVLNGSEVNRLPGHLSVCIPNLDAVRVLSELPEIALSLGAACSSNSNVPSHVLTAMGRTVNEIGSTLRIGLGRYSSEDDIDYISEKLCSFKFEVR